MKTDESNEMMQGSSEGGYTEDMIASAEEFSAPQQGAQGDGYTDAPLGYADGVPQADPYSDEPQYGAPQPLYEDFIPAGFSIEERKRQKEEEKARLAAEKQAEAEEKKRAKEEAAAAKKKEKEEKKRAKTQALIAAVEAKAEKDAKEEYKRETGEDYDPPVETTPTETAEEPEEQLDYPSSKGYTSLEKKLRRKYKLTNDALLSENDVVPGFVIAKGERLVRTYSCLDSGSGEGTICLTNKRLLINTDERAEINIDQVSGIKFSKHTSFNFLKCVFGLLFIAVSVILLLLAIKKNTMSFPGITGSHWKSWFPIVFFITGPIAAIIGLPLLLTMLKSTFYFYVYARMDSPFLEYKSPSYAKREKKVGSYKYKVAKAGKESEKAARELGALILEIKDGRYDY